MPRRTRESSITTRDRIIEAAVVCLRTGEGELTAREVMSEAGVSTGTLYHHFPSLDELVLAVAETAAAGQANTFGSPAGAGGIAAVLRRLFDPNRRDTVLPWLRQRAIKDDSLRDGLRRYDAVVGEWLDAALDEAVAAGQVRPGVDAEAAIEIVRTLGEGFQLRLSSDTLAVSPERFVNALFDLLERGWLAEAQPSRRRPVSRRAK